MKVSKSIQTKEGQVQFEGELNSEQLDLVIGLGLNLLLQQGAIPFQKVTEMNMHQFVDGTGTEQ